MSDSFMPSMSIISENITNESSKFPLEAFQPDLPIVSKNTETLSDSSFTSENMEILQPNSTSVLKYTEQDQHFDSLNFNNYMKRPNHRKKNKFVDNMDLTQFEDSISIEYNDENIEYETNFLATNFPIHIESDPNDILYQNFTKFFVCPNCHKLFWTQEYITEFCQSNCTCGAELKKPVRTPKGKTLYKPIKIYSYHSIILHLKKILLLPEIEEALESCYKRSLQPNDLLSDVYDGRVWHTFKDNDETAFFVGNLAEGRLGFFLNIDWFNPYKHSPISVGAIYLTILNFPRHMRYQTKNVFLVDLIPGPHEPSVTEIHKYIEPIAYELDKLWSRVTIKTTKYPNGRLFHGALILIACDTPAARKISGFAGHSSKHGCYRCTKKFPTFPSNHSKSGKVNFSGFNQEFPHLNNVTHKKLSNNWFNENNQGRKDITTEVMVFIYEEITSNIVASTLLKKFLDSINHSFRIFCNSISLEGTLAKYLIPVEDVLNLYNMSTKILEQNITGAKSFPEKFLKPIYFSQLDDITTRYLAQFYNKVYAQNRRTLSFTASCDYVSSSHSIFVTSAIEQTGTIYIGYKKFGSISSRSDSNSYIIAAFVDEKKIKTRKEYKIYHWPGKVLYYFKHQVQVPKEVTMENNIDFETAKHWFAFFDEGGRAHAGMFCAELWENSFYKCSVENILPVQRIFYRFFKVDYKLHRSTKYIAVIPINKKLGF
ncbi:14533_t:CDS:2 [Cetraspora pellucida]|uniref:14533_t:CDS:1 n=1 Tax=Cetraspora pellucida TaxID=1433469 RepID=A0A9N9FL47_9GLOM|nr:14533_t:CDS:2 [Cetraspora pellucida]